MAQAPRTTPFELKGGSFAIMVLRTYDADDPTFFAQLRAKIEQAPNFFRNAPIVIDADDMVVPENFDLGRFLVMLRELRLSPVAMQGGTDALQRAAAAAHLPLIPEGRSAPLSRDRGERTESAPITPAAPIIPAVPPPHHRTRIIREPIRSGQRVYAQHGDLIVLAAVSRGAEVLADGNVHIYGSLRGRALAGLTGDRSAHIFCKSFEAELVSIAGLYKVSEAFDASLEKKNVHIHLEGDMLKMGVLS